MPLSVKIKSPLILQQQSENSKEFDADFLSKLTLFFCDGIIQAIRQKEAITVKYLKQIGLILFISFLGEVCRYLIPLTIPASIYGMVLLFAALSLKIIRIESVRETGAFLTSILSLLFVVPTVQLMDFWPVMRPVLIPVLVICLAGTIVVFAVSGIVTQWLIRKGEKRNV